MEGEGGINNRVDVKIFGQDYIISGDKSREYILKVGDYVNDQMNGIAQEAKNLTTSAVAVLAAVNIADELFSAREATAEIEKKNAQMAEEAVQYENMWQEANRSLNQFKENTLAAEQQKNDVAETLAQYEKKCKELESSFFDLQMENIQLKSEIDRLRKSLEIGR